MPEATASGYLDAWIEMNGKHKRQTSGAGVEHHAGRGRRIKRIS